MEISQEKLNELLKDEFEKGIQEGLQRAKRTKPELVVNPEPVLHVIPTPSPFCTT